jgi:hypothetical protein
MELKVEPCPIESGALYHVVDAGAPPAEQPAVVFTAGSWAEAEQYIADMGGEG